MGAGNLPSFDARRAHIQPFGRAIDFGSHGLNVGVPPAFSFPVGVRDVVAKAGALGAHVTLCSHGVSFLVARERVPAAGSHYLPVVGNCDIIPRKWLEPQIPGVD